MDIERFKDKLAQGTLSRREINKALASVGLAMVTMPLLPRRASAAKGEAIYFTWSGYDIPELFPAYIKKYGVPPDTPVFGDAEEAFTKIRAGYQVDVTHPCSTDVGRWRDAGALQPIDTARLSNWPDVFPRMKTLRNIQEGGKQWFVPFDWGQTSITYRTDLVDLKGKPESWGILWDERYKGRLSVIDSAEDTWWCAAIYAGVDVNNITDADLAKVKALLEKQRPLLRFYQSDMTTVEQALASGEIVAAMTWNSSPLTLSKNGIPVRFAEPKEGALTWVCGLVLVKDAPHYDKAHDLIDAMISVESGVYLITEDGYGHSNEKAFDAVDEDALLARGLSKHPLEILNKGVFVQAVSPELKTKIERDWSDIKAGV